MSAKIQIIAVGKMKEKYFADAISEYVKRLSRFCKLKIIEVEEERNLKEQNVAQKRIILSREAARIISHLKNTVIIAMEVSGLKVDSERFSEILKKYIESDKDITFLIGGSLGLGDEVLQMSDLRLSMSDMTFPHQMARVLLAEQIYRAFKIIGNEKYHK